MMSNYAILTELLNLVTNVIARSTSKSYAVVNLTDIVKNYIIEFPFLKHVNVSVSTAGYDLNLIVEKEINETDKHLVSRFITKLLNSLFISDIVKQAIINELQQSKPILQSELQALGVVF